jgi:hypothetical protein
VFGRACHRIPSWATAVRSSPLYTTAWTVCHFHIKYLCVSLSAVKLLTGALFSAIAFPFAIQLIIIIFQYISNKMQLYTVYLYLETALHVSGYTSTRHQEHIQLYLQHPVFVTPLLGGVRHSQHTRTSSKSSTIAAGSSNGVTDTGCYRYSCMRSWWWVEVPPETCRAVSRYK